MTKETKRNFALSTVLLSVVFALMAGYVMNIVKIFYLDFEAPYKAEVIRIISVPTGIGCVTGWIKIED